MPLGIRHFTRPENHQACTQVTFPPHAHVAEGAGRRDIRAGYSFAGGCYHPPPSPVSLLRVDGWMAFFVMTVSDPA